MIDKYIILNNSVHNHFIHTYIGCIITILLFLYILNNNYRYPGILISKSIIIICIIVTLYNIQEYLIKKCLLNKKRLIELEHYIKNKSFKNYIPYILLSLYMILLLHIS